MNSPREFCRLSAHTSILLTYNFDALFFERVVLKDLWAGESGDILVLADPAQVAATAEAWGGQVQYLGRRYQLAPANTNGRFHPKIMLRLGKEGGYVWVGSGNLTHGGWGGNRELCAAWEVGPGRADTGAWVAEMLGRVAAWGSAGMSHDVAGRAAELPWVRAAVEGTGVPSDRALLTSFEASSLSAQVGGRWRGRRFTEARVLTGSTDEGGAQLNWLRETFGVERALVVLDENRASFRPEQLEYLPLDVDVRHLPGPPVHAKFYWLDGPDGPAAVIGSANCSASAWLRAPASGGNVEAVVVYDSPHASDFASVLDIFDSQELAPADLGARDTDAAPSPAMPHGPVVSEVVWDAALGEVRVTFREAADVEAVTLVTAGGAVAMRLAGDDGKAWAAELPQSFEEEATAFVMIEAHYGGGGVNRLRCWVNDLSELRHAARGRHISDTLNGLAAAGTPGEQQKIVEGIHRIGLILMTEPESFPDAPARRPGEGGSKPSDEELEREAINPADFVVSIEDLRRTHEVRGDDHSGAVLSLAGVLRALFGAAGPSAEEDEAEFIEEPDDDDPDGGEGAGANVKVLVPASTYRVPEERNTARLGRYMDDFLARMADGDFAGRCTATQLVQAAAFPLAVATLGKRGGWVDGTSAHRWVRQVFDLLFTRRHGGQALLRAVRERYEAEGRGEDFFRVVGDGTLWLALLASLGGEEWEGLRAGFERAIALRAVFEARELIASGDPGRMGFLLGRLGEQQARAVLEEAPEAARLLRELEMYLNTRWEQLKEAQSAARPSQRVGDLLWHPAAGWAQAAEDSEWGAKSGVYLRSKASVIRSAGGHYLNVTRLSDGDASAGALLGSLDTGGGIP